MSTRQLASPNEKPRRIWRSILVFALCVMTAVCPLLAAVVLAFADARAPNTDFINAGSITGLLLSPLVAVRTGRLRDFLIGPAAGLIAGFLDLKIALWMYALGYSISTAACVPVWGATLALWIASSRPTYVGRLTVIAVIAAADMTSRMLWIQFGPPIVFGDSDLAAWQWLIEAIVYTPAAVLLVLLAQRAIRNSPPSGSLTVA